MNLLFWREKPDPRISVKVGDVLTIVEFGRAEQVKVTAITDRFIYYRYLSGGMEWVVSTSEFKEKMDLSKIRTEIKL